MMYGLSDHFSLSKLVKTSIDLGLRHFSFMIQHFLLTKGGIFFRKEVFPVFITVLENTRYDIMNKILYSYFMAYEKISDKCIYQNLQEKKFCLTWTKFLGKKLYYIDIIQSIKCIKVFLEFSLIKRNNQTLTFFLLSP